MVSTPSRGVNVIRSGVRIMVIASGDTPGATVALSPLYSAIGLLSLGASIIIVGAKSVKNKLVVDGVIIVFIASSGA